MIATGGLLTALACTKFVSGRGPKGATTGGQDPSPHKKWTDPPTFHKIRSLPPSFENPGATTAKVPTPSSTVAPSVAQPNPPTFTAWLRLCGAPPGPL